MIINFYLSHKIHKDKTKSWLKAAIILNLGVLAYFKYSNFLLDSFVSLVKVLGGEYSEIKISYWLPLGISFYTFQIIAYLVDVSNEKVALEKSFINFGVFKCFYGQLIAGPIVRAQDFIPQLKIKRIFEMKNIQIGVYYILAGLFLKICLADTLAQYVDFGFLQSGKNGFVGSWCTIYAFAVQILTDFWGYSTIAIGVAYMYGINLPINFNCPYSAKSLREFWRKWHITLSFWLRDYLYIPLGGNRRKHARNLLITMTLGGLWHGASWNFVIWGLGHGLWLVLERSFRGTVASGRLISVINRIIVFHGVCLLWVFFRAPNLTQAYEFIKDLLFLANANTTANFDSLFVLLVTYVLFEIFLGNSIRSKVFYNWTLKKQVAISLLLILAIIANASAKLDFIYFVF